MKKLLLPVVVFLLFFSASANAQAHTKKTIPLSVTNTVLQYFIIKVNSRTYGYNVFVNGDLYMHQPVIPGLNGNKGFTDTASAGAVARLVIQKITQGEIPPAISIAELKRVNAIK